MILKVESNLKSDTKNVIPKSKKTPVPPPDKVSYSTGITKLRASV
jgi:hypothetical protein